MDTPHRLPPDAGIAIGPILFVLALLAVLATVMASGGSDFQVASGADRITADVGAQANLIRGTINQCNMQYVIAASTSSVTPTNDPYPSSDPANGTPVGSVTCTPMGGTALWGNVLLPPPTAGFNGWTYMNASASGGGRCIWTTPAFTNPSSSEQITTGLTHVAKKFNSSTAYSSASEVIYTADGAANPAQKFVVWITLPTGTPDSHCTLP